MWKKNDEATAGLSEWYMEWQPIETALKDGTGVLLAYRMTDVDPGFYVGQGILATVVGMHSTPPSPQRK